MYTIKEVADKLGITANAIRFYEKKGMICPQRDKNGYREYDREEITTLEMILIYRKMGFPVETVKMFLEHQKGSERLLQFALQYNEITRHMHTMTKIQDSLGECLEILLENPEAQQDVLERMEKTAKILEMSQAWQDRWAFDKWAVEYDQDIRKQDGGLAFYANYDRVLAETVSYIKGHRIVEIGIGTGNLAAQVLEQWPECSYIGIDQSINMLKEAKKKCPAISLRLGTFLQLPLKNGLYDTVVSSYALHHCSHEEKELAVLEMDRVLHADGRIVIADLMFENELARTEFEKSCSERQKEELADECFTTVDDMRRIFSEAGYTCMSKQIDGLIWIICADKGKCARCR